MDSILSSTIDWLCTKTQWGATFCITLFMNMITDSSIQTLSISYFRDNFFTNGALDQIIRGFTIAGISLSIILFFFSIYLVGIKDLIQQKDSFLDLFRRLFLSVLLTCFITSLLSQILILGHNIMDAAANERPIETGYSYFEIDSSQIGKPDANTIFDDIMQTVNSDPNTSMNDNEKEEWIINFSWDLGDFLNSFNVGIDPKYAIILLLRVVFFVIIAYNFAKLIVEYLKRYTTMFILYFMAPLFSAFFATASTQLIFLSYFKMFGTTVLTICLTKIWIFLSSLLMQNVVCNFVNMCIMLAFINFGVRIEMWTREIGMSTASLGGALLDNIVLTAGIMGRMAHNATGHIGNGLINAGGISGNATLAAAGSALTGRSLTPDNVFRTMSESAGGVMRTNGSRNWGKSNFTPSQKDLATKAMASNGLFRNTTLSNMYHSLNAAGKQELMTGLMNNTYGGLNDILKNAGMKVSDLTYDNKGINFTATGKNGIKRNCSIAEAPARGAGVTSIAALDTNGKQVYLNMQSGWDDLKNAKGTNFTDPIGKIDGTSAIEMETGTNLGAFIQDGDDNAAHYMATMNDLGNLDISYGTDAEDYSDFENIGTITFDGLNLFKGTNEFGDNMANSAYRITNTGKRMTSEPTNTLPFEADFALQFAKKGEIISIDCNGIYGSRRQRYEATHDGIFCNTGRTDIHGVERINGGKTIKFRYRDTANQNKYDKPSIGYVTDAYSHQRDATSRNICGDKIYGTKLMK